jgi:tetratricopeptide (TPR) repeat protein
MLMFSRIPLQAALNDAPGMASTYARVAAHASRFVEQLKASISGQNPATREANLHAWLSSIGLNLQADVSIAQRLAQVVEGEFEAGVRVVQAEAEALAAQVSRLEKRFTEALAGFDRAVALDSSHSLYWLERAETLRQMRRHEDALVDVSRALEFHPESAIAFLVKGGILLEVKQPQTAAESLERALALQPDLLGARLLRCMAWKDLRRYAEAMVEVSRILEQHPDVSQALTIRCFLLWVDERYADALADLERLMALESELIKNAAVLRGELQARLGRHEEALECFQRELAKNPTNSRAAYSLAVTRARDAEPSAIGQELADAWNLLQAEAERGQRAPALARLGGLEILTDNKEKALELLREAIGLDPEVIYWVRGDGAWSRLRDDPRFQELLGE